eukprot:Em0009g242a
MVPEAAAIIGSHNDKTPGRPILEAQQPEFLEAIVQIAFYGSAVHDRRRDEVIRSVKTLDELSSALLERGFKLSRSGLYLRLLPKNSSSIEGKRHRTTVPVKLIRAQNSAHAHHIDSHFCTATNRALESLASMLGLQEVFFGSFDDKARVPIGLTAAHKQAPLIMQMEYKVALPDHDWVVAAKHKLIPSVYAAINIKPDCLGSPESITYSGPTYIAIRSGKHSTSTAYSHGLDFQKAVQRQPIMVQPTKHISLLIFVVTNDNPAEAKQLMTIIWVPGDLLEEPATAPADPEGEGVHPSTCYQEANIQLASQLLTSSLQTPSRSESQTSKATPPSGFSYQLPYDKSVELVVYAAREYFNSAANYRDRDMSLAKSCLALIKDCPAAIQSELNLFSSLEIVEGFGLASSPSSCGCLFRLAHLLGLDGVETPVAMPAAGIPMAPGQGHTSILIANAAIEKEDFRFAHKLCSQLMSAQFPPAWEVCRKLAGQGQFKELQSKLELTSFVLTHCPEEELRHVLKERGTMEVQLLSAESHDSGRSSIIGRSVQQIVTKGAGVVQQFIRHRPLGVLGKQSDQDVIEECLEQLGDEVERLCNEEQVTAADQLFSKMAVSKVSLQLAIYYACLQIYARTAELSNGEPLLCPPATLMSHVISHVIGHSTAEWPVGVQPAVELLQCYRTQLCDHVQAETLLGLGTGIDVQRFTQDLDYRRETILSLARTMDTNMFKTAQSLAKPHKVAEWELYMALTTWLLTDHRQTYSLRGHVFIPTGVCSLPVSDAQKKLGDPKIAEVLLSNPQEHEELAIVSSCDGMTPLRGGAQHVLQTRGVEENQSCGDQYEAL